MSRKSLIDRKAHLMEVAVSAFAELGFYKTTTAMIAQRAGVTQPYIFHFFHTKEELYMAVLDRGFSIIHEAFARVEGAGEQVVAKMSEAFQQLLITNRQELLLTMHAFATPEPQIKAFVRDRHLQGYELIRTKFAQAGIAQPEFEAKTFIGQGIMITMAEVLEEPKLSLYDTDC